MGTKCPRKPGQGRHHRPRRQISIVCPISTRIRGDFAVALKKCSLERQLHGVQPNTLQDILEQAIEPWLKSNGYIP